MQLESNSATILIKTPNMKFNDKGFIFKFKDYTQVQIFSACQDLDTFNKENLSSTYPNNFLKSLFDKKNKEIIHKDSKNNILIKIIRD